MSVNGIATWQLGSSWCVAGALSAPSVTCVERCSPYDRKCLAHGPHNVARGSSRSSTVPLALPLQYEAEESDGHQMGHAVTNIVNGGLEWAAWLAVCDDDTRSANGSWMNGKGFHVRWSTVITALLDSALEERKHDRSARKERAVQPSCSSSCCRNWTRVQNSLAVNIILIYLI